MPDDFSRLAALRQGLTHSRDEGYVTIRIADLRWLLDQAGNHVSEPPTSLESEGEMNEPEHDRE